MKVVMEIKTTSEGFRIAVKSDSGRKPRVWHAYPTTLAKLVLYIIRATCETFRDV